MRIIKRKQPKSTKEVLTLPRTDRRTLSYVPDPEQIRMKADRRGNRAQKTGDDLSSSEYLNKLRMLSLRYEADFEVLLVPNGKKKKPGSRAWLPTFRPRAFCSGCRTTLQASKSATK